MQIQASGLAFFIAGLAASAVAQTAVTTSGTTSSGTVPVFSGTATVTNSPIAVSGSNVGIGTTAPAFPLEVYTAVSANSSAGVISTGSEASVDYSAGGGPFWHAGSQSNGNFIFWNSYINTNAMTLAQNGNVAINGSFSTGGPGTGLYFRTPASGQYNTTLSPSLLYEGLVSGNGTAATPWGLNLMTVPWTWGGDAMTFHAGLYSLLLNSNGSGPETTAMTIVQSGNVGIGTTSPQYTLDVTGTVHATGLINAATSGVKYPDGNTQTTAWTGVLCGGDYAEDMRADKKKESYEPGDVLVLSADDNSDVQKSVEPYSAMVAGIYATKPGVVGLRDAVAKFKDNVPMAMVGVVPTKVSAENGPIHKGDLLVTSSLKGFAMKGTDRSRMLGAVIGKAMGSLDSGTGVIEVLVTLQ